jgi:hypothetical protein
MKAAGLKGGGARRAFLCRKREENRHKPGVCLAVDGFVCSCVHV